jgi:transposase InsO family protein
MRGDLCGPVTPATPGGRCYFMLLIDDLSCYMWVVVLGSKGEAADAIRRAQAAAEAECSCKLRVLRTNNGGEFTAAEFASYCADEGVQRHYSAPYNTQQNDIIEALNDRTPYEAWHGHKPAVSHLRSSDASRSARSLDTSASTMKGALQGCSS